MQSLRMFLKASANSSHFPSESSADFISHPSTCVLSYLSRNGQLSSSIQCLAELDHKADHLNFQILFSK